MTKQKPSYPSLIKPANKTNLGSPHINLMQSTGRLRTNPGWKLLRETLNQLPKTFRWIPQKSGSNFFWATTAPTTNQMPSLKCSTRNWKLSKSSSKSFSKMLQKRDMNKSKFRPNNQKLTKNWIKSDKMKLSSNKSLQVFTKRSKLSLVHILTIRCCKCL